MNTIELEQIRLIGLALATKTSNINEQSAIDCGNLWQQFEKGKYAEQISNKLTDEIIAVYYDYEKDHTKSFSYFIGCKVKTNAVVPAGLTALAIPGGTYHEIIAKGKMPDCLVNAWKNIWVSDIRRAYKMDFEVYDDKSRDWNNAEVKICLSVL